MEVNDIIVHLQIDISWNPQKTLKAYIVELCVEWGQFQFSHVLMHPALQLTSTLINGDWHA